MPIFQNQMANVVEWNEFREDILFYKWKRSELKKGSRLIIRPGQDAIFLYNGRIEGIFKDEGNYEIESHIIPFLSTLKGFKFGFNSGLRAEVLFINTKEITDKWGTRSAILLPAENLPGGLPIRAFGTYSFKISDHVALIDKIAGIKEQYNASEVKTRVMGELDQLLMRWISKEGKDMFNLQKNSREIALGIQQDLDMELEKIGIAVTNFTINNISYPEEIQEKINQTASYSMMGDVDAFQRAAMADAISKSGNQGGGMGAAMNSAAGMVAGMKLADRMFGNEDNNSKNISGASSQQQMVPCASCHKQINTQAKFCPECGAKNERVAKFCPECGTNAEGAKFCPQCGTKL